jgi:hypothetical protein
MLIWVPSELASILRLFAALLHHLRFGPELQVPRTPSVHLTSTTLSPSPLIEVLSTSDPGLSSPRIVLPSILGFPVVIAYGEIHLSDQAGSGDDLASAPL